MRIREIRKERGLTAESVARQIGVTQAALSNWENGARNPKPDMIVKIAQVLECTTDELLGYERPAGETMDEIIRRRVAEARAGNGSEG